MQGIRLRDSDIVLALLPAAESDSGLTKLPATAQRVLNRGTDITSVGRSKARRDEVSMQEADFRRATSMEMNLRQGTLLSLSIRHGEISWCLPETPEPAASLCCPLNRPGATFQASTEVYRPPAVLYNELRGTLANGELVLEGYLMGKVKDLSSCLPLRRPCDHFHIEATNSIIFSEWFHFAQMMYRGRDHDDLLSVFGETIQARGSKLIWHDEVSPENFVEMVRDFLKFLEDEDVSASSELRVFYAGCFPSHGRRFGISEHARFCLLPSRARKQDVIFIPKRNRVPILVRPSSEGPGVFHNIGECFVHGIMHGEAERLPDTITATVLIP
jgi:hypothetical protein